MHDITIFGGMNIDKSQLFGTARCTRWCPAAGPSRRFGAMGRCAAGATRPGAAATAIRCWGRCGGWWVPAVHSQRCWRMTWWPGVIRNEAMVDELGEMNWKDGEGVKEATLIWEFHSLGLLYAACGRRSLVVPISANHQNQPISALTKRISFYSCLPFSLRLKLCCRFYVVHPLTSLDHPHVCILNFFPGVNVVPPRVCPSLCKLHQLAQTL